MKETLKIEIESLKQTVDIYSQTCTVYTTSPKYFMKFYKLNEVEEVGVCLRRRALSKQDNINKQCLDLEAEKPESDKFIPTETTEEAINKYKTALKVVDVSEVDEIKTWRQIWEKVKRDIIDFNKGNTILFGLIWLFSKKNLGYTIWLVTACLICNINLFELIKMIKALIVKNNQKELLEEQLREFGLEEIIDDSVRGEDLRLYMKIKDENNLNFN